MVKQGFGKLASLSEAIDILESLTKKAQKEILPLDEALNRVLFEDIESRIDVPHFLKSAMDGYALKAENTFSASQTKPITLKKIDTIHAGQVSKKTVGKGECIEITTGAAIPKGADSVMMVEHTEKNDNQIIIYKSCAPGENTIKIGSDVKKNQVVIRRGTILSPRMLGVLSSIGLTKVPVSKKPTIAYFSTGNEIIVPGNKLEFGKVYDINSITISTAIKENGCKLVDLGIVKDNLELIKSAVKDGIEKSDFVMLSGGSSLGGEDFMVEAVKELGTVLVHGIAVKPGKPVLIGKVEDKLVLGLPGYPTSALSNFYILVLPLIERILGIKGNPQFIRKKLSRKIASTIGRYQFLAVKIENDFAVPVMKGSSSISTLSECDGFVEIDENTEVLEKNEEVVVRLL